MNPATGRPASVTATPFGSSPPDSACATPFGVARLSATLPSSPFGGIARLTRFEPNTPDAVAAGVTSLRSGSTLTWYDTPGSGSGGGQIVHGWPNDTTPSSRSNTSPPMSTFETPGATNPLVNGGTGPPG